MTCYNVKDKAWLCFKKLEILHAIVFKQQILYINQVKTKVYKIQHQ